MANEEVNKLVGKILNDKMIYMMSRIDKTQNKLMEHMEELKQLDELVVFDIPQDFKVNSGEEAATRIDILHNSIKQVSQAANQLNLINSLLEGLNSFCARAALFLVKEDKLVGWKGKGFSKFGGGIGDEDIKKIFYSLSASTIFKYVLDSKSPYSGPAISQPDDNLIFSRFGGVAPESIFVMPFFVKGKPQAVIYTDTFQDKKIEKKEVEMLSIVGEMSLDLLPLRQKMMARVQTKKFVDDPMETQVKPQEPMPTSVDDEITVPSIKESDPERLARVIINDVILYNQKKVDDGRANRNLYRVLEDTIMQAKEQFLMRFSDIQVFERQLIQTLANGDKESLKGYKFETY